MASARPVPFDDRTPLVFFSDCHRGDNGRLDAFAPNKRTFLHALRHYYHRGFAYVEVGDGDELWKGWDFDDIQRAYPDVFELLQRFASRGRLHLLLGNHEVLADGRYQANKAGLLAHEAIVLHHARTGQRVSVLHGHQADAQNHRHRRWSRLLVRHVWTRLQATGVARVSSPATGLACEVKDAVGKRLMDWTRARRQMVICGHTHRPAFALPGMPPYFNTGACMFPGYITGIEITGGTIQLVRWEAHSAGVPARVPATPAVPLILYR